MVGNFKYLYILIFFFSCQNGDEKKQLAGQLIEENLTILLDDLDYFKFSDKVLSVGIYQYVGDIKTDRELVIDKFQEKFGLNNEKIIQEPIKLLKLPERIGEYKLFLDTDNHFLYQKDTIKVSFVNLIISKNNQFASVEVVKSLGSGVKFEIYYFKRLNEKWIFVGKEPLALG